MPSREDFVQRIKNTLTTHPYLVAEDDGNILGYAYAHPYYGRAAYQWTAEVSIYISESTRTKGIGTLLYDKLEALLARQGMVNLLACLAYPNPASEYFHRKRGYIQVAHFPQVGYKLGNWQDIIWMQKQLRPAKHPPQLREFKALDMSEISAILETCDEPNCS